MRGGSLISDSLAGRDLLSPSHLRLNDLVHSGSQCTTGLTPTTAYMHVPTVRLCMLYSEVPRNPLNTVQMTKRMLVSHVKASALIQEACSAGNDDGNRSLALFTTSAL